MGRFKGTYGEVFQSHSDRVDALRNFFPDAREGDWHLQDAGQRVQIIKKAKDGTLAALLGASPGASTAASAMLDVLQRCFPEKMKTPEWQARMNVLVPSYGQSLVEDEALAIIAGPSGLLLTPFRRD